MGNEPSNPLPPDDSLGRFLRAHGFDGTSPRFSSLEDACRQPHSALVMEGDCGGQIYLTCPVSRIACQEHDLSCLLADLNALAWCDGEEYYFDIAPVGAGVAGGMGGGVVIDGVWTHPDFADELGIDLTPLAARVLAGEPCRLGLEAIRIVLSEDAPLAPRLKKLDRIEGFANVARPGIPRLLAELRHPEDNLCERAAQMLLKIEPDSEKLAVEFAACISHENARVRRSAAEALRELGPKALAVLPLVEEHVHTETAGKVRVSLIMARYAALGDARQALSELTGVLNDFVFYDVVYAIYEVGERSGLDVIPALLPHIRNRSFQVQQVIARALGRPGSIIYPALPLFAEIFANGSRSERINAIAMLRTIGQRAGDAVPLLLDVLSDPDLQVHALDALVHVGSVPQAAVPTILPFLQHGWELARTSAARILGDVGVASESVLAALEQATKDPEKVVRGWAQYALNRLGGGKDPSRQT